MIDEKALPDSGAGMISIPVRPWAASDMIRGINGTSRAWSRWAIRRRDGENPRITEDDLVVASGGGITLMGRPISFASSSRIAGRPWRNSTAATGPAPRNQYRIGYGGDSRGGSPG